MNLTALVTLLKLLGDSGVVSPKRDAPTPPSSEAGLRPQCGPGEKAVFFKNPDRWVCVRKFD
jgi:hypothetical protein